MKFVLEVESGKDTLAAGFDLASQLIHIGREIPAIGPLTRMKPTSDTSVRDRKGNVVGKWYVTE